MEIPSIQVNFDYFFQLGQLPLHQLIWELFLDGGWTLVVFVAVNVWWAYFKFSRMTRYADALTYNILSVSIPRISEQTPKAMEHVFAQLASIHYPLPWGQRIFKGAFHPSISFEFVSVDGALQYIIRTPSRYRDLLEAAVYAQYPDAEIVETSDYVQDVPAVIPNEEWDVLGVEYALKKHWAFPIRTYPDFEHSLTLESKFKDPLSGLFEVMSGVKPGEQLWLQIILTPCDEGWHEKGAEAVAKLSGKKLPTSKPGMVETVAGHFASLPMAAVEQITGSGAVVPVKKDEEKEKKLTSREIKVLEAVQTKLSKPAMLAKVRAVYVARREAFNKGRLSVIKSALHQFGSTDMNSFKGLWALMPRPPRWFELDRGMEKRLKHAILRNYRNRSNLGGTPFYLNIEELATIYHFPMLDIKAPLLKKTDAKRAEPPTNLPFEGKFGSPVISKPPVEGDEE